jgi:hypothetical protein
MARRARPYLHKNVFARPIPKLLHCFPETLGLGAQSKRTSKKKT